MNRIPVLSILCAAAALAPSASGQVGAPCFVSLRLESPQDAIPLDPGDVFEWSVVAEVTNEGRNLGLAGVLFDILQSIGPDQTHGLAPSAVPTGMEHFSRPMGICNDGPPGSGLTTGYGGTPMLLASGEPSLVEIGGVQNTYGVAGVNIGTAALCVPGVGQQAGGQVVASGSVVVGPRVGARFFVLQEVHAILFSRVGNAGEESWVFNAPLAIGRGRAMIVVCRADFDGNGVLDTNDLFAFLNAWFGLDLSADIDHDGVLTTNDLFAFLDLWFTSCKF